MWEEVVGVRQLQPDLWLFLEHTRRRRRRRSTLHHYAHVFINWQVCRRWQGEEEEHTGHSDWGRKGSSEIQFIVQQRRVNINLSHKEEWLHRGVFLCVVCFGSENRWCCLFCVLLIKPSLPTHSCKVVPMKPSCVNFTFSSLNFHPSSVARRAAWRWMNLVVDENVLLWTLFVLPLTSKKNKAQMVINSSSHSKEWKSERSFYTLGDDGACLFCLSETSNSLHPMSVASWGWFPVSLEVIKSASGNRQRTRSDSSMDCS